ncbi:hypothetical protein FB474_1487 [Oryzihumus leptocrescens]|uniref:Uncharacterized protein n=1 Tax=Oryzihumus leptocrescens TaxID=297536 RepID=A0A542ZIE2_9MICO|nr:hypothetical protein FB474_1487 [Oryzihumus leptocrescens]
MVSGDAHALGWSILTRQYDMTPLDNGMGHFVSDPSLLDVANAYFCAYDFVAYGFHRLDELGPDPVPPTSASTRPTRRRVTRAPASFR